MKKIVTWATWCGVALGLGCAPTPTVEKARPYTFESGRTPYSAAICIARNAKGMAGLTAEERLQGEVAWEVVVRQSWRGAGALAVADIQPRGSGSIVSIRFTANPGEPESFVRRLMTDCQAQLLPQ
ncbi:MAG: hypothetical protein ACT4PS_15430 [Betaproteobacteria bacterium]